jgi:hypothetical protein
MVTARYSLLTASAQRGRDRRIEYEPLTRAQSKWMNLRGRIILWRAGNQLGKAQPKDALVLTPSGWKRMGDLVVGDLVIAGDGSTTRVTDIFEQGVRPVFRVTFDDGASTECCEQHVWKAKGRAERFRPDHADFGRWREVTLGEMRARWGDCPVASSRAAIPVVGRAERPARSVPLDPYVMGVLLGDGGLSRDTVVITSADEELIERVRSALPPAIRLVQAGRLGYRLTGHEGRINPVNRALRHLGLFGVKSAGKFIPQDYLHNSAEVRLELLRGLMDTDGDIGTSGCATFNSVSARLAEGVRDLVRSLGGKAEISKRQTHFTHKGERRAGQVSYRVSVRLPGVDIFHLARKRVRRNDSFRTVDRVLHSIEYTRDADCRCIEVDHPDETYVTDDYIVTHNSRGLAKKLVNFVMRRGPYANRRPGPVKILVVSISKEQMEPLHSKIWELLPKDQIADDVEFTPGYGFRGKPPRVTFTAGEGKGSVITFATYAQGSRRVAGGTFDVVACDEPLPERLFGEARARILHGDPGEMWITMTPTPDSPPLDYLREKVEKGEVIEINTELSVENVTLLNEDGTAGRPLLTQEQIDSFAGDLLEAEKDMRLRGGWDIVVKDRMLSNWGPACVGALRIPRGATIGIGIDHGAGQGKQAAALITIEQPFGLAPRVSVLEESVAEGYTTPDQDAEAILAMLARRGWGYDAVDFWIGDRASGMNRYEIRKSNQELMRQLARILGRRVDELKRIEVPYKFSGSVSYGFRMMNAIMGRRDDKGLSHFRVDPKCQKFIKAAEKWRGSTKDPLKDILDAVRYPTEKAVRPDGWFAFKATYA